MGSEMRRVSKEEFFATVGQLNVHPRAEKDACYWKTPDRRLIGKTTPGYLCIGEKAYFVDAARFPGTRIPRHGGGE